MSAIIYRFEVPKVAKSAPKVSHTSGKEKKDPEHVNVIATIVYEGRVPSTGSLRLDWLLELLRIRKCDACFIVYFGITYGRMSDKDYPTGGHRFEDTCTTPEEVKIRLRREKTRLHGEGVYRSINCTDKPDSIFDISQEEVEEA